ncbi:sialate O-acetylesterase [Sorangium sp. So ce1097]|uniref:sialate O-acetylesterase n=1 Tax=Sorangium sp. So ce1097 TaxID=3133330 RepID=UPI003F5E9F2C
MRRRAACTGVAARASRCRFGLGRTYNQWYPAVPPLHVCYGGVGPGDYFGKALAEAYPTATIWLVPCAIAGVDIDFFRKGVRSSRRGEFQIPPDNHWNGAYEWVIERARLAQEKGPIRGIIFHQGESDSGGAEWVGKVAGMVSDLRTDLGLGEIPFIAGELLRSGCCGGHNTLVNQLPGQIRNAFVVSSEGLGAMDQYHFNLAAQRTFGQRYGEKMIEALGR